MRILLIEDDKALCQVLQPTLQAAGFASDCCHTGADGLHLLKTGYYDACILDRMLPELDGLTLLKSARADGVSIPVLMLTALGQIGDRVEGLDAGADDYLAKPFNPLEAVARVNSNIRRFYSLGTKVVQEGNLAVRDLVLNQDACTLKKGDKIIQLTSVEYRIMELLMKHPGKVFTKQQIYEHGWGEDYIVADNNIMVCISKLRAKLDDNPSAYIQTIRGLGYRLEK